MVAIIIVVAALCVIKYQEYQEAHKEKVEEFILGDWYMQWAENRSFTLYEDGTVDFPETESLGKWSLSKKNQLELSKPNGEVITLKIDDVNEQILVVYEVVDGKQSENKITFFRTEKAAQALYYSIK